MDPVVIAASLAFNVVSMVASSWMLRRMSLLEGELRGLREALRLPPKE